MKRFFALISCATVLATAAPAQQAETIEGRSSLAAIEQRLDALENELRALESLLAGFQSDCPLPSKAIGCSTPSVAAAVASEPEESCPLTALVASSVADCEFAPVASFASEAGEACSNAWAPVAATPNFDFWNCDAADVVAAVATQDCETQKACESAADVVVLEESACGTKSSCVNERAEVVALQEAACESLKACDSAVEVVAEIQECEAQKACDSAAEVVTFASSSSDSLCCDASPIAGRKEQKVCPITGQVIAVSGQNEAKSDCESKSACESTAAEVIAETQDCETQKACDAAAEVVALQEAACESLKACDSAAEVVVEIQDCEAQKACDSAAEVIAETQDCETQKACDAAAEVVALQEAACESLKACDSAAEVVVAELLDCETEETCESAETVTFTTPFGLCSDASSNAGQIDQKACPLTGEIIAVSGQTQSDCESKSGCGTATVEVIAGLLECGSKSSCESIVTATATSEKSSCCSTSTTVAEKQKQVCPITGEVIAVSGKTRGDCESKSSCENAAAEVIALQDVTCESKSSCESEVAAVAAEIQECESQKACESGEIAGFTFALEGDTIQASGLCEENATGFLTASLESCQNSGQKVYFLGGEGTVRGFELQETPSTGWFLTDATSGQQSKECDGCCCCSDKASGDGGGISFLRSDRNQPMAMVMIAGDQEPQMLSFDGSGESAADLFTLDGASFGREIGKPHGEREIIVKVETDGATLFDDFGEHVRVWDGGEWMEKGSDAKVERKIIVRGPDGNIMRLDGLPHESHEDENVFFSGFSNHGGNEGIQDRLEEIEDMLDELQDMIEELSEELED